MVESSSPPRSDPLTALHFAEICQQIGLPSGVVNINTGDGVVGGADRYILTSTKLQHRLDFSGRIIRKRGQRKSYRWCLRQNARCSEDADLDGVVEGVADAIWSIQGWRAAPGRAGAGIASRRA